MPDHPINYFKYSIFLIIALIIVKISARPSPSLMKNSKLYEVSKRNLLTKELEYLKLNPLSTELRSFINRHKRRVIFPFRKRDDEVRLDQDHMYVVKDGEIVPFQDLQMTSTIDFAAVTIVPDTEAKFTVIPLIIPFTVAKDITPTEEDVFFQHSAACHVETTTYADPVSKAVRKVAMRRPKTTTEISTTTTTTTQTTPTTTEDEPETSSKPPVNPKLLKRIFQDIKNLMVEQESPKAESSICNVSGDWDSTAGGMQIRIVTQNDTKHPEVYMVEREPPMEEGFLTVGNWTLSAQVPYRKASILILNAHTFRGKKFVAVFIGECRICEQVESISGHWLIERQSKDCSDREVSHNLVSDVLKRNNVRFLQQQHLNSMVTIPTMASIF